MAITTISTVDTSDTFEKQRTQLNDGLTKLNNIDLTKDTLILEDSVVDNINNSDVVPGSFSLCMDQVSGDLFLIVKRYDDTVAKKFRLLEYDDQTGDQTIDFIGPLS